MGIEDEERPRKRRRSGQNFQWRGEKRREKKKKKKKKDQEGFAQDHLELLGRIRLRVGRKGKERKGFVVMN